MLNGRNKILVIRYSAGVISLSEEEIYATDVKKLKLLTMNRSLT